MFILILIVLNVCGQEATANPHQDLKEKASKGDAISQNALGWNYAQGIGIDADEAEAIKWFRQAAEQNHPIAQYNLGYCYSRGIGVEINYEDSMMWIHKAAIQDHANAQAALGYAYWEGLGVKKDYKEAVKWFRKAANQNAENAQWSLAAALELGLGTIKNEVESYKWYLLAGVQGNESAREGISRMEKRLTREQIAEGQRLAGDFMELKTSESRPPETANEFSDRQLKSTGTGFFITENGYLITNHHVIDGASKVRLITSNGAIAAVVVKSDKANDLALLKCEGDFSPLSVVLSRDVKLGDSVATVGFPNVDLQGFSPKLAKGEVASLAGASDDARYFQVSVPVQPGNSGGALVDDRGNVVGVISAKLDALETIRVSGAIPENVNYAVKSSFLLSFLESIPAAMNGLKKPNDREEKFEDVVSAAQNAAVLIMVY